MSFEEQKCPRTNIRAHFRPKWKLSCLLSFKSFSQRAQFENWGIYSRILLSFSVGLFGHVPCLDQWRTSEIFDGL